MGTGIHGECGGRIVYNATYEIIEGVSCTVLEQIGGLVIGNRDRKNWRSLDQTLILLVPIQLDLGQSIKSSRGPCSNHV